MELIDRQPPVAALELDRDTIQYLACNANQQEIILS